MVYSKKGFWYPMTASQSQNSARSPESQDQEPQDIEDSADAKTPRMIVDDSGFIVFANTSLHVLAGLPEDESAKGKRLIDILYFDNPEDAFHSSWIFNQEETEDSNILAGLSSGSHHVFFENTQQDATLQFDWIETPNQKKYLVISADEEDTNLTNRAIEIASLKSAQNNFPDDLETLRHVMELSRDMIVIVDANGQIFNANDNLMKSLGISKDLVDDYNFLNLIHDQDRINVRVCLQRLGQTDNAHSIEFECHMNCYGSKSIRVDWKAKKISDQIYCVGRDVSALRTHEEKLGHQQQQLIEAEAIGHMGHWHWVVGKDVIEWSDEIYRIFGVTRSDFVSSLENINKAIHKDDVERVMQAFQRSMIQQNTFDMDFRIKRPGDKDEMRYIRCQGRCELDSTGEVTALFGIMQDITERTLKEHDLRDAKESVERAYAAKSQFLANMSHELRTPLNAIIGFSEMMEKQLLGPIGTERYFDYIKGIRESGEHLLDLISDILDMSKIEAGKYSLNPERMSITKVIQLAVHMMEGRALETDVKITMQVPSEGSMMVADRRALMQVILNLLSNAVKFSHNGGKVHIACTESKNAYSITVSDEGIGIPAHKLQAVLRPFEQAASHYTRDHEGSGLGLAITKDLIELHGGSIDIESAVNMGTTVTIQVPSDVTKALSKKSPETSNAKNKIAANQ